MTNLAAAPIEIELSGEKFSMRPLTWEDEAQLDQWIRGRYIAGIRDGLAGVELDGPEWRATMSLAMGESMKLSWHRQPGLGFILGSRWGLARLAWQGIQGGTTHAGIASLFRSPADVVRFYEDFEKVNDLKLTGKKQEEANGKKGPT
jgi:hypothetical protein